MYVSLHVNGGALRCIVPIIIGLFVLVMSLITGGQNQIIMAGLGVFVVLFGVAEGLRIKQKERLLALPHAWLARKEWVARRIPTTVAANPVRDWVVAVLVLIPGVAFALAFGWTTETGLQILGGVLALIAITVISVAGYRTIHWRRYGMSFCLIDRVPIEPGTSLQATVRSRMPDLPPAGFRADLQCVRRWRRDVIENGQRSRQKFEDILFKTDSRIATGAVRRRNGSVEIPVTFDIPRGVRTTDERDDDDRIVWELTITGEVPGVDYRARFQLPVFPAQSQ